jgi:hypothetical protein
MPITRSFVEDGRRLPHRDGRSCEGAGAVEFRKKQPSAMHEGHDLWLLEKVLGDISRRILTYELRFLEKKENRVPTIVAG